MGCYTKCRPNTDLELFAAGGALELVAVAAAPVLAVLPPHPALERLPAVRTEKYTWDIQNASVTVTHTTAKSEKCHCKQKACYRVTCLPAPDHVLILQPIPVLY